LGLGNIRKLPKGKFCGARVLGGLPELKSFLKERPGETFHYITANGNNRQRADLVARVEGLRARNLRPWSLRHPGAWVGGEVEIGPGACLAPGSLITTRVKIGRHCILNVNASVSHDCSVGDFVNINPGAVVCGGVVLGEGAYIGAGAVVIERVRVGAWTVVGAGAVVAEDLPANVTAVGVPARIIKRNRG